MTTIPAPYPYFTDASGNALEAGKIYIGTAGLDPRTNPIAVYQDEALTIAWAQPIRTVGGYPVYIGAPSNIYTAALEFSLIVATATGEIVIRDLNVSALSSNDVTFVQSGTGAVPRTVQDKLRETVSVKDFGAALNCNPFTGAGSDDTAAIQAAVNAVGVAGGGTILIPGWAKITSPILVSYPNVQIVGTMRYASGLRATFANASLVRFYNVTPFTGGAIANMSLRAPGSCTAGYAVEMNNASAITVSDLEIKNTWRGCGYLGSNTACRTVRVDTSDLVSDAFYIAGGNNQYFDNCTGYQNFVGGALFHIVDTLGYWISNCVSQIHTYGILINPGTGQQVLNGFVQNCDLDLSTEDGLRLDSTGGGLVYNQEFVNVRRAFSSKKGTVITGSNTKSIRILGSEAAKNIEEGVRIFGGDDIWLVNNQTLGNSATGPGAWGLYITGGDNIHVIGGSYGPYPGAGNNQQYGIAIDSSFTGTFLAVGANLKGNTIAGAINSSATGLVRFEGCLGYVPPPASAITVGASPFTYTAGAGRQTLYIRGGTVSDVKVGAVTVFSATGCTVTLEPGQSAVITYSSAPTIVRAFT